MILTPMSFIYRAAILFRHFLYDRNFLTKKFTLLPVVSVGNVMAGGAGKTQVVLLLCELLSKNFRVAILSRGYRGQAEHAKDPHVIYPSNRKSWRLDACKSKKPSAHSQINDDAQTCGDEPFLLSSRLVSTLVVVNKSRFKSALVAEKLGAQVLVLDDGMQHRRLHRDYEIVVIDGKTPFGSFLPKGRLREDLKRLKMADLILFVGEPSKDVEYQVSTLSSAPQIVATIASSGIFYLNGEKIDSIAGNKVAVFCGLGNPQRFVKTIEELGADVVVTHFAPDHCVMKEKELHKFALLALEKGANFLVCSEKDKVKLLSAYNLSLPIIWMRATLEIVKNQSAWIKSVNELKVLVGSSRS